MTSSNGNIFRVTGHLCREFTGDRWFPRTKASDTELWCFLWTPANRLSEQSWGWWFETPLCLLWRHCNACLNSPLAARLGLLSSLVVEGTFLVLFPNDEKHKVSICYGGKIKSIFIWEMIYSWYVFTKCFFKELKRKCWCPVVPDERQKRKVYHLVQWGLNKMADILLTTFSWMKSIMFWLKIV